MIQNPFDRYTQYMYSYPHKTAYRPLKGINLKDYSLCLAGPGQSLYLHLPFCQTKCGYCNLFSVTGQTSEAIELYLDAVERQSRQYRAVLDQLEDKSVCSDFTIGGGTPLLLSARQLERMFSIVRTYFPFQEQAGLVIETAPAQTTPEKLRLLKARGATRVSMGIQSFSDRELAILRRFHCASQARKALDLLMEAGFPCVNIDFIYGIPGQTVSSLLRSLEEAAAWKPEEIFLYPLYIKHGAGLEQQLKQGMVLDPELAFEEYREGSAFLKSQGYRQDSMRRFVRLTDSGETVREFGDCGFSSSLALGCGGRSYLGNLHACTPYATTQAGALKELKHFIEEQDHTIIRHGILLNEDEMKRRYVIRNLLILPGLSKEDYRQRFSREVREDFPLLNQWIRDGYAANNGDFFSLTDSGLGLSDYLGPQLISEAVRTAMNQWEVFHGQNKPDLERVLKEL